MVEYDAKSIGSQVGERNRTWDEGSIRINFGGNNGWNNPGLCMDTSMSFGGS